MFFKVVTIIKKFSDPKGNFVRADVLWEGEKFSFVSVYAPTDEVERKAFFSETLQNHFCKHPPLEKFSIAGDFNFVECPFLDRSSHNPKGTVGHDQSNDLLQNLSTPACDLFRNYHSSKKSFTFYSASHKLYSRLDRCYASNPALPFSSDCKHVSVYHLQFLTTFLVSLSLYEELIPLCEAPRIGN
jgi:exonuclease III